MGRIHRDIWLALALILATAAGCAPQPSPKPALRPAGLQEDACAERLHDIAGQLLWYYAQHRRLPQDLSQISTDAAKPVCPVCKKPYIYNPAGQAVPNLSARAIVWDAEPCHSGIRWGIVMESSGQGQSLDLKVIPLPQEPVPQAP